MVKHTDATVLPHHISVVCNIDIVIWTVTDIAPRHEILVVGHAGRIATLGVVAVDKVVPVDIHRIGTRGRNEWQGRSCGGLRRRGASSGCAGRNRGRGHRRSHSGGRCHAVGNGTGSR